MSRRHWTLIALVILVLAAGLTGAFHRDLDWIWRYVTTPHEAPVPSSRAVPTCLGCRLQLIIVEGDGWFSRPEKDVTSKRRALLTKSYLFTNAYANSLDPEMSLRSIFSLRYPNVGDHERRDPDALPSLLANQGYVLEILRWSISSPEELERRLDENRRQLDLIRPHRDTLTILLSPSGTSDLEKVRAVKNSAIHIPLMIFHPETKAPGAIHDLISLVDLGPLLLNLAGAPAPKEAEGRSLMSPEPNRPIYGVGPGLEYAFDGRWKLIRKASRDTHIYYLPLDPNETEDLATLRNPWVRKAHLRLSKEMDRWRKADSP